MCGLVFFAPFGPRPFLPRRSRLAAAERHRAGRRGGAELLGGGQAGPPRPPKNRASPNGRGTVRCFRPFFESCVLEGASKQVTLTFQPMAEVVLLPFYIFLQGFE